MWLKCSTAGREKKRKEGKKKAAALRWTDFVQDAAFEKVADSPCISEGKKKADAAAERRLAKARRPSAIAAG